MFEKIDSENQTENVKSIWAKLKLATIRRNGEEEDFANFKQDRWLSWVCIRNAEILQQMLNTLTFSKSDTRQNAVNKNVLVEYYRRIADYSMSSYDKDPADHNFKIDYSFANVIADALEHGDHDWFDSIYPAITEVAVPYGDLFDIRRREPYNKEHVRRKIEKYMRGNEIAIPRELILQTLNGIQGDTMMVEQVKSLIDSINNQLEGNGGAPENA